MTPHNRRNALRLAGSAGLLGAVASGTAVAATTATADPATERTATGGEPKGGTVTFVVVTGASGTPGGINELALRGHRTVAVELPGHSGTDAQFDISYQAPQDLAAFAARPSPMRGIGLDDYERVAVDTVRRVARYGPVVLYGGSMGGATLDRVGNAVPELIDRIVYDSAFCCVDLASCDDYLATPEGSSTLFGVLAGFAVGDPLALGALRCNYRTADPDLLAAAKQAFMADATDTEFHTMLAGLQPDDTVTVGQENAQVHAGTWGHIPRTFIRHTKDLAIPLALQDRMIAEADTLTPGNRFHVRDVSAGHAATAAEFAEVIDILDELGTRVRR